MRIRDQLVDAKSLGRCLRCGEDVLSMTAARTSGGLSLRVLIESVRLCGCGASRAHHNATKPQAG